MTTFTIDYHLEWPHSGDSYGNMEISANNLEEAMSGLYKEIFVSEKEDDSEFNEAIVKGIQIRIAKKNQ